jgi:hypothetical protein
MIKEILGAKEKKKNGDRTKSLFITTFFYSSQRNCTVFIARRYNFQITELQYMRISSAFSTSFVFLVSLFTETELIFRTAAKTVGTLNGNYLHNEQETFQEIVFFCITQGLYTVTLQFLGKDIFYF